MSAGTPEPLASSGDGPGLRPERIQLTPEGPAATGSKGVPERRRPLSAKATQAYLTALPGWRLAADGRSLRRKLRFTTEPEAAMYLNLAFGLATVAGFDLEITIRGGRVGLRLPAPPGGGWTAERFDFARSLEAAIDLGG